MHGGPPGKTIAKKVADDSNNAPNSSDEASPRRLSIHCMHDHDLLTIPTSLKAEAENILDQIGLSSSDAIRMFYKQITMSKGLPFEARIPNATTREALRDAEAGRNLTRYADTDDLFRKLGVKGGKS